MFIQPVFWQKNLNVNAEIEKFLFCGSTNPIT